MRPNQSLQWTAGSKPPAATERGRSAAEGFRVASDPDGDATQRVHLLLEALPGVRVVWCQPMPGKVRFGLVVSDPRTLARLVHLCCLVNLPLQAEVDWSCPSLGEHDDPGCIRYDLRVPADPPDAEGWSALGMVAQLLSRELERFGVPAPDAEPGAAADGGA